MTNVTTLFTQFITEGAKAAELITDHEKRAVAYAQLAQACAQTNLIGSNVEAAPATKAETVAAYKEEPTEAPAPAPMEVVEPEEPTPAPAEEVEAQQQAVETAPEAPAEEDEETAPIDKWTDETLAQYADQLSYFKEFAKQYTDEVVNTVLNQYSSEQLNDYKADLTPRNIKGFEAFLRSLVEADSAAE